MRAAFRGFPSLFFVALVLAALLVPVALADHAYSHRYVVHGRVTTPEGAPIENVTVLLQVDFRHSGLCHDMPNARTDAWGPTTTHARTNAFGEWSYCIHAHAMPRDAAHEIRARLDDNVTHAVATVDPLFRKSVMNLQVEDAPGNGTAAWDATYTVSGRLWRETGNTTVEGVNVHGVTVNDEPVTVRYVPQDGAAVEARTRTDGYGDFAVRLDVAEVGAADEVRVEATGATWKTTADATLRWTDVKIDASRPPPEDPRVRAPPGGPVDREPVDTPTVGPALVALAVVAATAMTVRRR